MLEISANKTATTLEQSKALMEAQVNPCNADMRYEHIYDYNGRWEYKLNVGGPKNYDDIPAWSLSELLNLLVFYVGVSGGSLEIKWDTVFYTWNLSISEFEQPAKLYSDKDLVSIIVRIISDLTQQ